jgi:hypothetical protein
MGNAVASFIESARILSLLKHDVHEPDRRRREHGGARHGHCEALALPEGLEPVQELGGQDGGDDEANAGPRCAQRVTAP